MTIAELVASAGGFESVEEEVASEYAEKKDLLAALMHQRLLERPDINALLGQENLQVMRDNHANHALFMASLLRHYDPEVLVNSVLWVFRAYRARGFHPNYWTAQLNAWIASIEQELSLESAAAILPIYRWMIAHIPQFTHLTDATADQGVR